MKNDLLFVQAKSRLGLIHAPNGETALNIGVETGPEHIFSNTFVGQFPNTKVITFSFTPPEKVSAKNYYDTLVREYQTLIELITQKLNTTQTLVTAGGDHSIALGSIGAVLRIFPPEKTGIIMIDSHGDIHQPSTSPSGNFHGMWLRPVVDQFEVSGIDALVPQKLAPKNLLYIGNLDIEVEEKKYMATNHIAVFDRKTLGSSKLEQKLEQFIQNLSHIHLSIDIDAFTHTFAPATGMMIANGLAPSDIFPILEKLKKCQSLSIDIVEVNPTLPGSKQTIQLAQTLLKKLL